MLGPPGFVPLRLRIESFFYSLKVSLYKKSECPKTSVNMCAHLDMYLPHISKVSLSNFTYPCAKQLSGIFWGVEVGTEMCSKTKIYSILPCTVQCWFQIPNRHHLETA